MPLNHVSRHLKQHVRAVDRRAPPRGSRATTVDEARPRRRRNASPRAFGGRAGDVHGEVDVSPDNNNSRATGSRLRSCYRPTTNGRARDAKDAARAKNVSRVDRGAKTRQWNFSKNPEISFLYRSLWATTVGRTPPWFMTLLGVPPRGRRLMLNPPVLQ